MTEKHVLRFVRPRGIYVLILLTVAHCVMVQTQYSYKLALNHKCLGGHEVRSFTVTHAADCFLACVQECLCLAFQMFDDNVCQLLSTSRQITPSSLIGSPGCFYYDFLLDGQQCQQSLVSEMNCCATSSPCQNNGLCEQTTPTIHTKRPFRCNCPPGYTGDLCQSPIKSCRGYINGSRAPGNYKVFDANMNAFKILCAFDNDSSMAWSLIQSYQLQKKHEFNVPFQHDSPVQEETPNWVSYRISKSRMESIRGYSSKWRATCRYDSDGLNYTDYVRASIEKIDILKLNGFECQEVEFINVRGYQCAGCTAFVAQRSASKPTLHVDCYFGNANGCSFQPKDPLPCGAYGEDSFGVYACVNPSHRCSASPASTTQIWFGGE